MLHSIFKKIAEPVQEINAEIKEIAAQMHEIMEEHEAFGMGANMVGVLKRIIVVNMRTEGSKPLTLINPEIIWSSKEMQTYTEASLCFRGIQADIQRAKSIKVKYLTLSGVVEEMEAEGFFATVLQHEIDYLNGIVFLDYLSKMKRDMLLKKMMKV